LILVENLTVKYNASEEGCALRDISFSLQNGERVALIGANGAGKSTLLLSLVGVLAASAGSIALDQIEMNKSNLAHLREKIGMVFQNPDHQLFMPTVYEDIAFGPRNFGCSEEEIAFRMDRVLESLGIQHLKDRLLPRLSGGEKRLVALAGVLVMNPQLLLLDEPSSMLDPRARRRLITILDSLPQSLLLATHDLDMALDLCDRVILLKKGMIYADGPAAQILSNAQLLDKCGLEPPLSMASLNL